VPPVGTKIFSTSARIGCQKVAQHSAFSFPYLLFPAFCFQFQEINIQPSPRFLTTWPR
jgi:hypothetical protein